MEKQLVKEQEVSMFEHSYTLEQLIKITRAEKETLDHQVVLAKSNLTQLRQEHSRLQGEFNQWKMAEEQKFKNELSKRHNQLIDQENKMNIFHKDLEQRRADLLVKEERYLDVEKEKNNIGNARIEVEKIRINGVNLMSEADRKLSEANSAMSQANIRIEESRKLDEKNNIRNQELVKREDKLQFDLKNLEMERNHLIELKEVVEPKIKEIKEIEDNISNDKKEIELKHQDVINKLQENAITFKALEEKSIKLDLRERELNSKESEFKRRVLISENKKT